MAASIVQAQSASSPGSSTFDLTLGSAVLPGSMLLLSMFIDIPMTTTPTIYLDGLLVSVQWSVQLSSPTYQWVGIITPSRAEGVTAIRFEAGALSTWVVEAVEVSGAATVEGDVDAASSTGSASLPATPTWTSLDSGLVFSFLSTTTVFPAPVEAAGWTQVSYYSGRAGWQVAVRAIVGAGAEASEVWLAEVADSWAMVILPVYDLGLRVPDATAFASSSSARVDIPGSYPQPVPVVPFIPDINPLPPDPDEIVLPLPPWVPGPGPYREQ